MKALSVLWTAVMLAFGLLMEARAASTRIAIIDTDPHGDLEPLLVAELSKTTDIELVERTEIEQVLRERALSAVSDLKQQVSIASFLHANGLLIISKVAVKEGELLSVRLTAAEPGVVLGSALFAIRKDDSASLARDIAARFTPLWPKLNVKREQALPISLLNLRCPVKSAATEELEKQLTFLFANRLMAQPELFVLERWRLEDAAFEKAFAHATDGGFWNGSYIVDGEIQTSGTTPCEVRVKVFARSPRGKEDVKTIEAEGSSDKLPELASALAEQFATVFAKQPAATAWAPLDESREYLREAGWAYRAKLNNLARSSLEASRALGNRDPKQFQLGSRIYSSLACPTSSADSSWLSPMNYGTNGLDVTKNPESLRYAQLALDNFRGVIAHPQAQGSDSDNDDSSLPVFPGETMSQERGFVGSVVLLAASRVVRNAYEHGLAGDARIQEIRAGLRELFHVLLAWWDAEIKRDPEALNISDPCVVGAAYYPYWFDTPEEQVAACDTLLHQKLPLPARVHLMLLRCGVLRCDPDARNYGRPNRRWETETIPRLIGWKGQSEEALKTAWDDFIAKLLSSPVHAEQFDGMLLRIASDEANKEVHTREALEAFWNAREELVAAHRVDAAIGTLDAYLKANKKHLGFDPNSLFDHAYCMKWLLYLLEHSDRYEYNLFKRFWKSEDFTLQEADTLFKVWLSYRDRLTQAGTWVPEARGFENELLKRFPQLHPAPPNALHVTRFLQIPESPPSARAECTMRLTPCGNTLWISVTNRWGRPYRGGLYGVHLPELAFSERVELADNIFRGSSSEIEDSDQFCASTAAFYYRVGSNLHRYDRKTGKWTSLSLPGKATSGWTGLLTDGEDLFVARSTNYSSDHTSGIWKWIAATGEFQTISSNRRRPPQNQLDDCPGYFVSGLFLGPERKLGACINYYPHLYNSEKGQWEPLNSSTGSLVYVVGTSENPLLLSDNGAVALLKNPDATTVEWCRGETPDTAPKNAGVLASAFTYALRCGVRVNHTLSYCNGKLWHYLPHNESQSRFHTLQGFDWTNPNASTPPIPLVFEMPEDVQEFLKAKAAKNKHEGDPMDHLRVLATETGLVFWAYNLPGFWFVSMDEVEKAMQNQSLK